MTTRTLKTLHGHGPEPLNPKTPRGLNESPAYWPRPEPGNPETMPTFLLPYVSERLVDNMFY